MSSDPPGQVLVIRYCEPCGDRGRALDLAREVLEQWAGELSALTVQPTRDQRFSVSLGGSPVYDRVAGAPGPEPGEIVAALESRLGPPPGFGA